MNPRQKSPPKNGSSLEHIGERIRAARLKAHLTQEELAGEDITRNMLSRIENGAALPSLPTLCALAKRLGIPAGALLDELSVYDTRRLTGELRAFMIKKRYASVLKRFESSGVGVTDELAYILYSANVGRAWELYGEGLLTEASHRLDAAEIYAGLTDSDISDIQRRAQTCRLFIACYENPAQLDDASPGRLIFGGNETAIYLYARCMLRGVSGKAYSVPDENAPVLSRKLEPFIAGLPDGCMKAHIKAKLDMVGADYLAAKAKLVPCVEAPSGAPPTLLFDFYTDLELCCKCCGDFENAYKYSGLKLELMKKIK